MPDPHNSSTPSNTKSPIDSSPFLIPKGVGFINKLPVAIYTCDPDGKITFYNDAAAELWGQKPEIGIDKWYGSAKTYTIDGTLLSFDSCPIMITLKQRVAVKGEQIIIEKPDGKRRYVKPFSEPLFDADGIFIGAINTLVDQTDEKIKEAVISEKEEKYRNLSDSLEKIVERRTRTLKKREEKYHKMVIEIQDYAILLLDKKGNIMNWNKGAEKIKGYLEEEVLGKNFSIFYLDKDRQEGLPQKLIHEARVNGRAMHEGLRLRKDGTTFWGYIVITALHNDAGKVIGFSKVTRDLTERKLAEDKMKAFANDIKIRNEQLEEYAHVASHDLQEPIRKIQIFSELLKDQLDDQESIVKNAEKINRAASRMSDLIKEVLKYSQLSITRDLMVPTDLNLVLQNVKEDLDLYISEKNATIVHGEMPIIQAIPIQIYQLFFNLIGNAIKFGQNNPVVEIVASINDTPSGKMVQLAFKDNGVGFDQQYADQVFKLFKRLNTSESGTGIGLALCKKIVENHKGDITVTSEIGAGTTFHVTLPIGKVI